MTEAIIKLFNSEKNFHNAQLIFSSHDTNILTQKLFRRDQIWFTEKDIYGATHLYSLIDFGTRKDASLEKNYLEGRYGSIPAITELEYEYE
jgi:AAA15 family ATPase/GTPase